MKEATFPVAEIFGPTLQGEGVDQGVPCAFVRFGGCDFKCDWCDTPHAVLPENVRTLGRLTAEDIAQKVEDIYPSPPWVILSGGNPAIYDLSKLVAHLSFLGYRVAVETQATKWQHWFNDVDRLCLSPKPPSSKMKYKEGQLTSVLSTVSHSAPLNRFSFLKIVVFDDIDYEWAKNLHTKFPEFPLYLSAGNDAGKTVGNPDRKDVRTLEEIRNDLLVRSRWLTEKVLNDPLLCEKEVVVQAQHHVLLWGNEQGV